MFLPPQSRRSRKNVNKILGPITTSDVENDDPSYRTTRIGLTLSLPRGIANRPTYKGAFDDGKTINQRRTFVGFGVQLRHSFPGETDIQLLDHQLWQQRRGGLHKCNRRGGDADLPALP